MGESSLVYPDVVDPDDMPPGDIFRYDALEWVENVAELDQNPGMPPTYIVCFADLLERGWGWDRLVAYQSDEVEWCDYKNYLVDYFTHNAGQVPILCGKQKPETVGEGVAAEYGDLHAAANLCIKLERKLLKHCRDYLTPEDIRLSKDITNHARHLIGSEDESSVAAAGMVCIAKEAELIVESLKDCDWNTNQIMNSGNQIRRSASKLMRYKGSKSADAVAGAMLGSAIEAQLVQGYLISEHPFVFGDFKMSHKTRECKVVLLTKLEEELAQETADEEKKSKLVKKREKKLEKRRRKLQKKKNKKLQKKLKLNGGNEIKLSLTVAKDKDFEEKTMANGE